MELTSGTSCLYPSAGTAGNAASIGRKASDRSNQSMEAESSSSLHAFILRPWAILDYHALNEAETRWFVVDQARMVHRTHK